MLEYEYTHVDKVIGDERADKEIRELLANEWELDESADSRLLVFNSSNPQQEIPAAKYAFKRKKK